MNKIQKYIVLFALFIVPLIFYIFLSVSTYNFAKLPVLNKNVADISNLDASKSFQEKVSVVAFPGKNIDAIKGELFNLNEKIYKKFYGYTVFQFIMIAPKESEQDVNKMLEKLAPYTNMIKWEVVFASDAEVLAIYDSFGSFGEIEALGDDLHTSRAFIIDKELNLRGRTDDDDTADGRLYGYNMQSVSELTKKMHDDVKIVIAEYKFALKKNNKREI